MPNDPLKDHIPLEQEYFKGLFSRGVSDSVPDQYFSDCLNNKFGENEVSSRDGSVSVFTKSTIVRFFKYKRLGETPRYICLLSTGDIIDSLFPNNPIWSDAAIVDFSCVNYNNRLYITPHNRTRGIPGKYVIVYQGTGIARLAGGTPPTAFAMTAADGSAGSVEVGYHIIAVCYRTDTGYITTPSNESLFILYNAPGDKKVNLASIPKSPDSYVNGRVILATKSIPVELFDGNSLGYEFFFVPNGTINDNTSTTFTIDFFDAGLETSADYLLDNLNNIPAGVCITSYAGRLVVGSANGEEHTVRLSGALDPETFNSSTGLFSVDPTESSSSIKNCIQFRKNLILAKSNKLYLTSDNGDDPSTWNIDGLDISAGTECFGFSKILDSKGSQNDRLFFADQSGLLEFNGIVKRPELSYNIEDIWKRINKAYFNLVQVVNDPVNHAFFISVPLDAAVAISHILYADYSKAFTIYQTIDEKQIKWSIWTFAETAVSIVADSDSVTFVPVFEYSTVTGIYDVKGGLVNDVNTAINSYIKSSLKTSRKGWINHFGGVKLRVTGVGTLTINLTGEDGSNSANPPSLTLASAPGLEPYRIFNFINEKLAVKLGVNSASAKYTISRLDVWSKPLWLSRSS